MIRLSERLEKIAGFISLGDKVADIGTDHGYIPIYLKQNGISSYIIAGDINKGPLEKMEENMDKHIPDHKDREGIIMRLGSGLDVIERGEVDTAVIAGMGGLLMEDILSADWEKTRSVKRFILQPRNAQDKLRKWLLENGFSIVDEILARESRFVWEILCVEPCESMDAKSKYFGTEDEQYEVGQHTIRKPDPLLKEFITNKLAIERKISENAGRSDSEDAALQKKTAEDKIRMLEGILENVYK
ncbi:MAG: SAM-dependent methyltransferase [Clostridiales bacterium]|nr:SAM-dependent methyltransferase [Clostridiales bacterium]